MAIFLEEVSLVKNGTNILKSINWKVEKGEHWTLFGLNGAGKTALLNMINAYYFPTRGKMTVLDKEFGKTPLGEQLRTKIGLVSSILQQKLYPGDSSYEIVLSGAFASIGLYETPTEEMRKKAISLLTELGCLEYADRTYETLSQGEKQRVLIARALMGNPEILIFDEPTNGIDFIARENLLDAISSLAEKEDGPTMIYVTHHVEEILPVFTKTLLLKNGEVFASGKTTDMISGEALSEFFNLRVEVLWNNGRPLLSRV